MTDQSGHGVTVSTNGSNPLSLCSNQSAPAIYIDDATGIQVTEDWWPGDPYEAD